MCFKLLLLFSASPCLGGTFGNLRSLLSSYFRAHPRRHIIPVDNSPSGLEGCSHAPIVFAPQPGIGPHVQRSRRPHRRICRRFIAHSGFSGRRLPHRPFFQHRRSRTHALLGLPRLTPATILFDARRPRRRAALPWISVRYAKLEVAEATLNLSSQNFFRSKICRARALPPSGVILQKQNAGLRFRRPMLRRMQGEDLQRQYNLVSVQHVFELILGLLLLRNGEI